MTTIKIIKAIAIALAAAPFFTTMHAGSASAKPKLGGQVNQVAFVKHSENGTANQVHPDFWRSAWCRRNPINCNGTVPGTYALR